MSTLHHSPLPHPSIHPSTHRHLTSALSKQRGCMSAQRVCELLPAFACMYVSGSGCMSWPPPACRFMLLIGCMSLYTTAGRDGSHASHAVMARAVTAPGRTDGGSHKKKEREKMACHMEGRDALTKQICDLHQQISQRFLGNTFQTNTNN